MDHRDGLPHASQFIGKPYAHHLAKVIFPGLSSGYEDSYPIETWQVRSSPP